MSDTNHLTDNQIDLLKHIELIQRSELNNRREAESKIFTWSTNIILTLIGALLILRPSESAFWVAYGYWGKGIVSLAVAFITIYSSLWQTRYRKYRDQNASVITKIDKLLHYYEKGFYMKGEALFPDSWMGYGNAKVNFITRILKGTNNTSATVILGILAIAMIWLS